MDAKIIAVVIGALLGGTISTASFYFKNKKEVREKVNELLFHLLEIWSAIATIRIITSDNLHILLIDLLKERFPYENINEEDELSIKKGLISSLPVLIGSEAGSLDTSLLDKFKDSTNELAKIYPLLAFDLNRNTVLINILSSIDKLVLEVPVDGGEAAIFENIRGYMLEESLEGLEEGLITLASSSGYRNKKKTKLYIESTRNRMESIPSNIFDDYLERVIGPAIQARYDEMGVKNPNIETEEESTECT